MSTPIKVLPFVHHQRNILMVQFDYNKELVNRFRELPGARWSKTLKSWYLPDTSTYRIRFGVDQKSAIGNAVIQQIDEVNKPAVKKMEELLILKNSAQVHVKHT